jgi:signal transduction histidine kinase
VAEHYRNPGQPIEEERNGRVMQVRMQKLGQSWASVARDVTEQRQAERHARQAQRHQTVSQLVAGVAHDFNNLLATIFGQTQLGLKMSTHGDATRVRFEEIERASERGVTVVRQLVTFVRGDEAAVAMAVSPVVEETVGVPRLTLPGTVELSVDTARDVVIRFAPRQLQQVLLNLCLNSRDTMRGKDKIRLRVRSLHWRGQCRSCGAVLGGPYGEVSVVDDGPGMTEATLAHAFDPFFTTQELGEDSGMGCRWCMALCTNTGDTCT